MLKHILVVVLLVGLGTSYWRVGCELTGASEPWDGASYWSVAYPVSLVLSGGAGLLLQRRGWLAGLIITFAQLPVLLVNSGGDPLWAVGCLLLCVPAVPAAAISAACGRLSVHLRSTGKLFAS